MSYYSLESSSITSINKKKNNRYDEGGKIQRDKKMQKNKENLIKCSSPGSKSICGGKQMSLQNRIMWLRIENQNVSIIIGFSITIKQSIYYKFGQMNILQSIDIIDISSFPSFGKSRDYFLKQQYRRKRGQMGCTPNFDKNKLQTIQTSKPRSTIEIQFLDEEHEDQMRIKNIDRKLADSVNKLSKDEKNEQETNEEIKQRQQKIKYFKGSKNFMEISIEANNYVNHALITLSNNPLLYDHSYPKLIGLNKKVLCKNQNRYSYLAKKQQKMEMQIRKQKEKILENTRSQYFGLRKSFPKPQRKLKTTNKQNIVLPSLFYTLNKDTHNQKTQKLNRILSDSLKS